MCRGLRPAPHGGGLTASGGLLDVSGHEARSNEPVGTGAVKSGEESVSRNCVGDQAQRVAVWDQSLG